MRVELTEKPASSMAGVRASVELTSMPRVDSSMVLLRTPKLRELPPTKESVVPFSRGSDESSFLRRT